MNITATLPSAVHEIHGQLGPIPKIAYASIALEKLVLPEGLFDDKAPALPETAVTIVMPILIAKTGQRDNYVIIDGCKRFQILKGNFAASCTCGIFENTLDLKKIGLLRMLLNVGRQTSLRETMFFYKWLQLNYSNELSEKIAQEIGLPVFDLKPIGSCTEDVINTIADGRIALRNAVHFTALNNEDRKAFIDIFNGFLLSQQTQRQFLEWLPEIAYARNISLSQLLSTEEISLIINNVSINNPQKIEHLRELFFSWKFPAYNNTLKNWKTLVGATMRSILENDPSSRIVFIPDPAFEKNKLEVRICVEHARAAKELFEKLSVVPQNTWARLIYPIEE
jgi:hypothetical protein